jgi:[acyl-carrier-protein] S-malonyltransferase
VAGHSLGEYTACAAAGAFPFVEGVKAVKARALAMAAAVGCRAGTMLAVMGANPADVDAWVAAAAPLGPVLVANRNAPDQLIVSGALEAVEAVEASAKAAGARAIRLKVAGAFHSPLMQTAADRMREVLAGVQIVDPAIPVIGNVGGEAMSTGATIRAELGVQLVSAVKWDACVKTIASRGVTLAIEAGPGKVLAGLVRRNDRNIETLTTGRAADLEDAIRRAKGDSHGTS